MSTSCWHVLPQPCLELTVLQPWCCHVQSSPTSVHPTLAALCLLRVGACRAVCLTHIDPRTTSGHHLKALNHKWPPTLDAHVQPGPGPRRCMCEPQALDLHCAC